MTPWGVKTCLMVVQRETSDLYEFLFEKGYPNLRWIDRCPLPDFVGSVNVTTRLSFTHVAERSSLRVEIQDTEGFLCAMLLHGGQVSAQDNGTVGNEEEELFGVFDIGLDNVLMVVDTAPVLVFATGIVAFARPKKVVPVEGPLRITPALPEVFDMLAVVRVEAALAVSAAPALHHFQGGTDFLPISIAEVIPGVPPMLVSTQARWTGNMGSIEFVHGPNRSSGLEDVAGFA